MPTEYITLPIKIRKNHKKILDTFGADINKVVYHMLTSACYHITQAGETYKGIAKISDEEIVMCVLTACKLTKKVRESINFQEKMRKEEEALQKEKYWI